MPFWKTFFAFRLTMIHAAWYFPHSLFFHQNDVWESTVSGRRENTKCWCALPFPFLSFLLSFSIMENIQFPKQIFSFLFFPFFPRNMFSRQLFLIKLFLRLTFRWPHRKAWINQFYESLIKAFIAWILKLERTWKFSSRIYGDSYDW